MVSILHFQKSLLASDQPAKPLWSFSFCSFLRYDIKLISPLARCAAHIFYKQQAFCSGIPLQQMLFVVSSWRTQGLSEPTHALQLSCQAMFYTLNPSASKELAWDCWELLYLVIENIGESAEQDRAQRSPWSESRALHHVVSALTQSLQLNCGGLFLHHVHQSISGKSPFILGAVLGMQCHLGRPATCQASSSVDTALIKTDKNPFFPRVYLLEEGHSNGT